MKPWAFNVGDTVWVRDRGPKGGGYRIVRARVIEQHSHNGMHAGESYVLDDVEEPPKLSWRCYPKCRVFFTRAQAIEARIPSPRAA